MAVFQSHGFNDPNVIAQAILESSATCGIYSEHEQHTCVPLVEITTGCNLKCPLCFAESGPGGKPIDFATYKSLVDSVDRLEGIADIPKLSGGEPTVSGVNQLTPWVRPIP